MQPLRILHVVPSISAEASGPSYSVPALCRALGALGHEVHLVTLEPAPTLSGLRIEAFPAQRWSGKLGASPSMLRHLVRKVPEVDIVHNHSLWMLPNVYPGFIVHGATKLLCSPRGTLSEQALRRSPLKKRLAWMAQRWTVRRATCLHATSEKEVEEIRAFGLHTPVARIPNGVELPPEESVARERTVLFLGRLHPIKGIDLLLRAWSEIERTHPDWSLRIAGPAADGYDASLRRMVSELNLRRVRFEGPVYGNDKFHAYRKACIYVLPSHTENFGMTVAEALACSTPVVVSHGAPWQRVETQGCGRWVPTSVDGLREGLTDLMARPTAELRNMGERGQEWMTREFAWGTVAREMTAVYAWALRAGDPPACIRFG